jgi:hypothetical protein
MRLRDRRRAAAADGLPAGRDAETRMASANRMTAHPWPGCRSPKLAARDALNQTESREVSSSCRSGSSEPDRGR